MAGTLGSGVNKGHHAPEQLYGRQSGASTHTFLTSSDDGRHIRPATAVGRSPGYIHPTHPYPGLWLCNSPYNRPCSTPPSCPTALYLPPCRPASVPPSAACCPGAAPRKPRHVAAAAQAAAQARLNSPRSSSLAEPSAAAPGPRGSPWRPARRVPCRQAAASP